MKAKDIANKYRLDYSDFEQYLNTQREFEITGLFGISVPDEYVDMAVKLYNKDREEKKSNALKELEMKARVEKEQRRIVEEKQKAIASILITSGFSFDGYNITRYSGYISGDDAVQLNRDELFINAGQNLTDALALIRIKALKELKEAAYDLGCNAVIGVDFDYITFEPETANAVGGTTYHPYIVCVTANGNAVVIEKNR